MPFSIIRNDITKVETDAIVNAANTGLHQGGGVCGAIFHGAGEEEMRSACAAIGGCPTGEAVITPGFRLPARYVIHTAGPVWRGGGQGEEALLRSCYRNSLKLAAEYGLESVAFPLISAGIYGYPQKEALAVAVSEIRAWLSEHEMTVLLVVFDRKAVQIGSDLTGKVQRYIDDHYVETHRFYRTEAENGCLWEARAPYMAAGAAAPGKTEPSASDGKTEPSASEREKRPAPGKTEHAAPGSSRSIRNALKGVFARKPETFSQRLLHLIDEKGMTDVQAYKKANVDRKLFSKIRSNSDYAPSKRTALSFAVALELSLEETRDLLMRAGYALSVSSRQDVIVEYFIKHREYDMYLINETLFAFGEQVLN